TRTLEHRVAPNGAGPHPRRRSVRYAGSRTEGRRVAFDLVITGGLGVDGTGAEPVRADVAVEDGRIALVGACEGRAERRIDAEGAIVTPGFVDIHTHYDGQVSWDDELAPSCFHGVTTAVMGNCGVGFAPVR